MITTIIEPMAKIANILSWSIDDWYWAWSILSLICLVGTVVAAIGTIWTGRVINARQSADLISLGTRLEEQKEKTALAQRSTLELEKLIKERRQVPADKANEILDWGAKGVVNIAYPANSEEAGYIAAVLVTVLRAHAWTANSGPAIMTPEPAAGITLVVNGGDWPDDNPATLREPAKTLYRLLDEAVKGNPKGVTVKRDAALGAELAVTIGAKY